MSRSLLLAPSLVLVLAATACSSAPNESAEPSADSGSPFADTGASGPDSATEAPAPLDSGSTDASPVDTAPEAPPACVPTTGDDDPDDEFKDTDCDGIDGSKKRAVFVSPEGSDSAPGDIDAPLKTLGKALELAGTSKKDIYLCNATYPETITVTAAVRVFGGYDCKKGWKRTLDRPSLAPKAGVPLTVKSVEETVLFDRIEVRAPDGSKPGDSSIAVWLSNSKAVKFRNSILESGSGSDGASPEVPLPYTTSAQAGVAGGGASGPLVCEVSPSSWPYSNPLGCEAQAKGGLTTTPPTESCQLPGGAGGLGGLYQRKFPGKVATTGATAPGGFGGTSPLSAGAGLPGKPGSIGALGASSTLGFGSLSEAGYTPTNDGTPGANGDSGGGGGGGCGGNGGQVESGDFPTHFFAGGGGGEGGFGGCGGAAGKAGKGGGASIVVVAWKSSVVLTKTTLTSGTGGRGGAAGQGGAGQPGGAGGKGGRSTYPTEPALLGTGWDGGTGGTGGRGGAGGAGGGGPSLGIVWAGATAPITEAVTFNMGSPGAGGIGIAGATPDGSKGVGQEQLEVKP